MRHSDDEPYDDFEEPSFEDEFEQRGIPPVEDLPQECAVDAASISALLETMKAHRTRAQARGREQRAKVEERRRRLEAALQERLKPVTPQRIFTALEAVLRSEDANAVSAARAAMAMVPSLFIGEADPWPHRCDPLLRLLHNARVDAKGRDREHFRQAHVLVVRYRNAQRS